MPNLITSIEEVTNVLRSITRPDDDPCEALFNGYKITTSQYNTIWLLIDNEQRCCESWGYFMSEDSLDEFIGAAFQKVSITDTSLKTFDVNNIAGSRIDEGDVMFVNIVTDRGVLQFVAYNAHNGYYGHWARVESEILNLSRLL